MEAPLHYPVEVFRSTSINERGSSSSVCVATSAGFHNTLGKKKQHVGGQTVSVHLPPTVSRFAFSVEEMLFSEEMRRCRPIYMTKAGCVPAHPQTCSVYFPSRCFCLTCLTALDEVFYTKPCRFLFKSAASSSRFWFRMECASDQAGRPTP